MKQELAYLYTQINMFLEVVKMMDDVTKSDEAKAWIEGNKFAYKNVLKLIEERVKDERK